MDVGVTGSVAMLVSGMKANTQRIALDICMGGVIFNTTGTRKRKARCDAKLNFAFRQRNARCEAKLDFAFRQAGEVVISSFLTLTGI